MKSFLITCEELDEIMGFNITDDCFFSEGTVIMYDGQPIHLKEQVGCQLVFKWGDSEQLKEAQENLEFFYERSLG